MVEGRNISENYLKDHCYSKGEYCATGIIGSSRLNDALEVIDEAIYQACLWEQSPQLYFKYAKDFLNECINEDDDDITTIASCAMN